MVRDYKCPNCGASMVFNSDLQKMVCEHCKTEKTIEEMENAYVRETQSKYKEEQLQEEHREAFRRYTCPSCGAEILTDENTVATFCSFCGSPSLLEDRLTEKTPSFLIPFKINRQQAIDIYRSWCKKGNLTPKNFLSASTVDKITGIYVPFWLYDYEANVSLEADCTKVRIERKKDMEYTYTDYFRVTRNISDAYQKIPADASKKMPDDVMDKLEPFSYQEIRNFEMPYLSGYFAEKFDYTSDELKERVEQRVKDYIVQEARNTINGYATTVITRENIKLNQKTAKYTMLPVWILNYHYKGKEYLFAINGQTGKIVGKHPVSGGKTATWFGSITIAAFLLLTIIGRFL